MAYSLFLPQSIATKFVNDLIYVRSFISVILYILDFANSTFLRILLRYRYGAPSLPQTMPSWQTHLAKIGHFGLYFLMGLLIVSGITTANFTNDPIVVFGLFNLSSEVDNLYMFELIRGIHEFATNAIIALITIHVLAAIYHHFIVKDDTTKNMLKFWTRKSVR